MYNLIEYSDNYSDSSGTLWVLKTDSVTNNADVTDDDNSPSFKYKSGLKLLILKQMEQNVE